MRLFAISTQTGLATPLTATPSIFVNEFTLSTVPVPITGVGFGIDFNPALDRLRVVTDTGFNFRINPNTGALIDGDANTNGVQPDGAQSGSTATASGAAYTNNSPNSVSGFVPTTFTTLYTLDAENDRLSLQSDPNAGTQTFVGDVTLNGQPLDFTAVNGFDIPAGVTAAANNTTAAGRAFASLTTAAGTRLYGIELSTGAATDLGPIASGTVPYNGLAIQSVQSGTGTAGTPLIGLNLGTQSLVRFNSGTPAGGQLGAVISGVPTDVLGQPTEVIVGIDFRPATGQLFGLGVNAKNDTGTLYRIDPQTAVATPIGAVGSVAFTTDGTAAVDFPDPAAAGYGFGFNPVVDRIRVTTSTGLNFRLNPNDPAQVAVDGNNTGSSMTVIAGTNPDGAINGATTGVDAVAYTNGFGQPLPAAGQTPLGPTTQYTLDSGTNSLFIQSNPNGGLETLVAQVKLNGTVLDFEAVNGFDIPGNVRTMTANMPVTSGFGFAALTIPGMAVNGTTTNLFRIDLRTAEAFDLGPIGIGAVPNGGLAAAQTPAGTVAFTAAAATATEGGNATITLTRTEGTSGSFDVTVTVSGGTATAGTDFTTGPYTVTFADGQLTAELIIPIVSDALTEGNETVNLLLSASNNESVRGAQDTATLTITDVVPLPQPGTIQFASATATGAEGGTAITLTLTRTGGTAGAVTVLVNATGGTAANGTDYTGVPATVTFADGQTTATLVVPILDDTTVEGDETAIFTISGATGGAVLGTQTTTTLTIADNDVTPQPLPGTIQFAAATTSGAEGGAAVTLTLTRTGGTTGAVTVLVNSTGGTAAGGTDFTGVPAVVTFADGQTTATLVIPILDDTTVEGDETADFTLSGATGGAALGMQTTTTLTIADNDVATPQPQPGTMQFASVTAAGAEGGPTITLTLTRTGGTAGAVTVQVNSTGGTAVNGSDFTGVPAVVTFADGQTTATLVIPVLDDSTVEGNETALFTLSGSTGGATLGTQTTTTLTIADNDITPPIGVVRLPFLAGGPANGTARLVNGTDGTFSLGASVTFPGLPGVTRVAVGDLNGDGTQDYVGGAGPGGNSRVVALDGKTNAVLFSLDAYESTYTGGVFVTAGDLDGDGRAEVIVTPDLGGGPVVAIFRGDGTQLTRFFGIEDVNFRGGARTAVGDLNGDGRRDLVVAAGFGGGPRVALFDGRTVLAPVMGSALPLKLRPDFFVFEPTLRNGVFVAAGDLTRDGAADLVFGGGPGSGPRVSVLNGRDLVRDGTQTVLANFFAGDSSSRGGVRVAARDADGDGLADLLVGTGDGLSARVRAYRGTGFPTANGTEPTGVQELSPFDMTVLVNGVFVG